MALPRGLGLLLLLALGGPGAAITIPRECECWGTLARGAFARGSLASLCTRSPCTLAPLT